MYQMVAAEGGAVGCALLKRSIYSNRTVSSALLTVLLEYIDFSAEMQPLTVLISLLHQQHLLSCNSRTACMQYSQKEIL